MGNSVRFAHVDVADRNYPHTLTRRLFLRGVVASGSLAALGVLVACAGAGTAPSAAPATAQPTTAQASKAAATAAAPIAASTPVQSNSNGAAKAPLPSYIPFNGPKPHLPGTSDGIDPGYFSYPKNTVRTVQEAVGTGDFSAIVKTTAGLPAPVDQNPAWQEVNKRLGMNSNLNIVATADYPTRLPALIAGGDLPDMVYNAASFVSHAPELLAAQFADLTPYLSGDAIKDYPNLANFPTVSWT